MELLYKVKGGRNMYPNLEAELARKKLTNAICAKICKISEKSFSNKRSGKTEFTLLEIKLLQEKLFPNCTFEYLFADTLKPNNKKIA